VADASSWKDGQGRKTRRLLHEDGTGKGRATPCLTEQDSYDPAAAKAVPANFCRHDGFDPQKRSGNAMLPVFHCRFARLALQRPKIAVRSSFKGAAPEPTICLINWLAGRRVGRMHARTRQYRNIEPSAIPFLRGINGHGKPQLPCRPVFPRGYGDSRRRGPLRQREGRDRQHFSGGVAFRFD
jgi:hypothetical protein